MTGFFDGLGVIGWVAVFLRIGLILSLFIKSNWWVNYDERFPRLAMFEDYVYTEVHMFIFMVIRGIVLFGSSWIVTSFLIYIG